MYRFWRNSNLADVVVTANYVLDITHEACRFTGRVKASDRTPVVAWLAT